MRIETTNLESSEPVESLGYYAYSQNNSGGSYHRSGNVAARVYVEAKNWEQANKRAEDLGIYFNGCRSGQDCSCCGDRWSEKWRDEADFATVGDIMDDLGKEFRWGKAATFLEYLENEAKSGDNIYVIYKLDGSIIRAIKE